jgi:hypothetical protein
MVYDDIMKFQSKRHYDIMHIKEKELGLKENLLDSNNLRRRLSRE